MTSGLRLLVLTWVGLPPFWTPSTMVGSVPTAIVRDFTGALRYEACQSGIGPSGGAVIIHRAVAVGEGGACCEPCSFTGPLTLAQWCATLRALPVPPRARPTDPGDLYEVFQAGKICP